MTKRIFCLAVFGILICGYANAAPGAREHLTLGSPWQFQIDVSNLGETERWFDPVFDRSAWARVEAPKAWDLYDEGLWGYEGVGWYTTTIDGSQARAGKVQTLRFDRVNYFTKVWLNGELLGQNIGGHLPFEFDISGKLRPGANVIVLRVDNRPKAEWLPGSTTIEWILYGGILGPVTLETAAPVHITDLTIRAQPEGDGAMVDCDVAVRNADKSESAVRLRLNVVGEKDASASQSVRVPPGATTVIRNVKLSLDHAKRWSPATPSLYTLAATIESDGRAVDRLESRFGVRKVEVRGRDILLNGQRLKLRGVNRYDDMARFGPNPPKEAVIRDLKMMKQVGVNFIRVHYPQSPELISLYDEMGFLMMEEISMCWWDAKTDILPQAMPGLEGLIRRDKNHPSVIIWSMANECTTDSENGIRTMRTLLRRAKELDPTRLATFVVGTYGTKNHRAFEDADLVATNVYRGQFQGEIARHIGQLDQRVRKTTADYIRDQLAAFPTKPLLVGEFGSRGVHRMRGDVEYTEDFQAAFIRSAWQGIHEGGDVAGVALWCWADYYHRRDYIQYAVFGPYGVITVDGQPKAALKVLTEIFGAEGK